MYAGGPPIHKLSQDILHYIFLANADEADIIPSHPDQEWCEPDSPERPLVTARRSSQVCRAWRGIILNSSSLWGRLLDLDGLQQQNPQWREEVLRRAGSTTSLWVSRAGPADPYERTPPVLKEFLYHVLDGYWERIEILFVRLWVEDFLKWVMASPTIRLPAPTLRSFTFLPPFFIDLRARCPVPCMFSNNAPGLEMFVAPVLQFATESSRFTSLRSFSTSFPPKLSILTGAISYMPLLEKLEVFPCHEPLTHDFNLARLLRDTTQIALPRLKELMLEGSFSTCLVLAKAIEPAAGCTLDFDGIGATRETLSGSVLVTLIRVFNKYFASHVDRYNAPDVMTIFDVEVTELKVGLGLQWWMNEMPCSFHFSWDNPCSLLGGEILRALFFPSTATLPTPPGDLCCLLDRFAAIEQLHFRFDVLNGVQPCVKDILAAFTSLKTIQASKDILSFIFLTPLSPLPTPSDPNSNTSSNHSTQPTSLTPSPPSMFPALQTLSWFSVASTSDVESVIKPILQKRVEVGCKLRLLDFLQSPRFWHGQEKFELVMQEYVGPLVERVRWREEDDVVELWAE